MFFIFRIIFARTSYVATVVDFSNFIERLNFLFLKAKPFKFFFIAMQGWLAGNIP
jgi:hypothetical protein